jgi:hypothetical protein
MENDVVNGGKKGKSQGIEGNAIQMMCGYGWCHTSNFAL